MLTFTFLPQLRPLLRVLTWVQFEVIALPGVCLPVFKQERWSNHLCIAEESRKSSSDLETQEQRASSAQAVGGNQAAWQLLVGVHVDQDRLCSTTDKEQAAAWQAG